MAKRGHGRIVKRILKWEFFNGREGSRCTRGKLELPWKYVDNVWRVWFPRTVEFRNRKSAEEKDRRILVGSRRPFPGTLFAKISRRLKSFILLKTPKTFYLFEGHRSTSDIPSSKELRDPPGAPTAIRPGAKLRINRIPTIRLWETRNVKLFPS